MTPSIKEMLRAQAHCECCMKRLDSKTGAFLNEAVRIAKSRHSIETKIGLLSNLSETTENADCASVCKILADVVHAQRPELLKNDGTWAYLKLDRSQIDFVEKALRESYAVSETGEENRRLNKVWNRRK